MAELVEFDQLHTVQFQPMPEVTARASNGAGSGGKAHRQIAAPAARRRRRR
jgi:hypothetical protein